MPTLHFIHQAMVPVRSDASDAAEMVNQLLFGELVEVLESKEQWRFIRHQTDNYKGWIDEKMIHELDSDWLSEVVHWEYIHSPYSPVLCRVGQTGYPFKLVFGSRVPIAKDQFQKDSIQLELGSIKFRIPRLSLRAYNKPESRSVLKVSQEYLGAPYLWGGRSPWGIDCSGLTQMVYGLHGVAISRDASQQVSEGEEVNFAERRPGDLAFFENDKGRVHHVGIILEGEEIRHAHGNVHDDFIDNTGIYNRLTERKTHRLCRVKRFL